MTPRACTLKEMAVFLILLPACSPAIGQEAPQFSPVRGVESTTSAEQVRDRLMIEDVWSSYVHALDTMDADRLGSLFSEDAQFIVGRADGVAGQPQPTDTLNGRAQIVEYISRFRERQTDNRFTSDLHGRQFSPVRHVVTSLIVDLEGSVATAESFWTEVASGGRNSSGLGLSPNVLNMGRYEDIFVKRDGRWLIKQRRVIGDMWDRRVPPLQAP